VNQDNIHCRNLMRTFVASLDGARRCHSRLC
jgi:hypothetical protein